MSRMVSKCIEGNIVIPFKVREYRVALSHLQFADDPLSFFCFGNEESFRTLNHILAVFKEISGLRINRGKCSVMRINCGDEKLRRWSDLVGCEVVVLPSSYLGLLLVVTLRRLLFGILWWIKLEGGWPLGKKDSFPRQEGLP